MGFPAWALDARPSAWQPRVVKTRQKASLLAETPLFKRHLSMCRDMLAWISFTSVPCLIATAREPHAE
jgi:hypothetical protein